MKYLNPERRRVRKSLILIVSCGHCKSDLVRYQKVGRGNLLRMYIDRIIESEMPIHSKTQDLICPNCHQEIANRIHVRQRGVDAFRMHRATYNIRQE